MKKLLITLLAKKCFNTNLTLKILIDPTGGGPYKKVGEHYC